MCFLKFSLIVITILLSNTVKASLNPNVVLIVADDLGWDDVSFHGSDQFLTPNIDLLAYTGVTLHRLYSHCLCTPSRSAILTGKFAHKIGMQGYPLTHGESRGLPLTEKILPQYFKDLGYSTHLVGKWHVGHSRYDYLPTFRGFDSYYGHKGGFIDYYEYTLEETWSTGKVSGLDLFRNVTADWAAEGYVTDLYTREAENIIKSHDKDTPLFLTIAHNAPHSGNDGALLQAPPENVRTVRHVESPERRILAAMVKKLDESVGDIVEALNEKEILNNTIIVFMADNGAPTQGLSYNYGSNWPMRGEKMTPWEGGVRVAGLIWAEKLRGTSNLWNGYMHAVDLLPTLIGAIDGPSIEDIDGKNLWNNIIEGSHSERNEFYEIYDGPTGFSSIVSADYKLVIGPVDENSSKHLGGDLRGIIGEPPSYINAIENSKVFKLLSKSEESLSSHALNIRSQTKLNCKGESKGCQPENNTWCLYNIVEDPCEEFDLSEELPELGQSLLSSLLVEMQNTIPREYPIFRDPRANPRLFNFTWSSFLQGTAINTSSRLLADPAFAWALASNTIRIFVVLLFSVITG